MTKKVIVVHCSHTVVDPRGTFSLAHVKMRFGFQICTQNDPKSNQKDPQLPQKSCFPGPYLH